MSAILQRFDDYKYLEPRDGLHMIGADWKYAWWPEEIEQVIALYRKGYGLTEIARQVEALPRDTFLLLLDLAEQGKIRKRKGYVWGAMV